MPIAPCLIWSIVMAENYPNRDPQNPDSADQGRLPRRDRTGVEQAPEKGNRPTTEGVTDSEEIEQDEPADTGVRNEGGQGFGQGRGANPGQVDPDFRNITPSSSDKRERRSNRADAGLAEEQDHPEGMKRGSDQQDPPPTLPPGAPAEERDTL
jgi:hypothetical protein